MVTFVRYAVPPGSAGGLLRGVSAAPAGGSQVICVTAGVVSDGEDDSDSEPPPQPARANARTVKAARRFMMAIVLFARGGALPPRDRDRPRPPWRGPSGPRPGALSSAARPVPTRAARRAPRSPARALAERRREPSTRPRAAPRAPSAPRRARR